MKVSITTGRITGLKGEKFYCCRNCYQWLITFTETSQANFCNSVNVYLGEWEEEAEKILNQYKKNFENAEIYDEDEVAILYSENGGIFAIGKLRKDIWIDVNDQFTAKSFSKLKVFITGLKVNV